MKTLPCTCDYNEDSVLSCERHATLFAAAHDLLAICEEISKDKRVDLVLSERRLRLYAAIQNAGGEL